VLDQLPESGTMFAERIDGQILPESRVVVLQLTEEELNGPVAQVAGNRAPGTEYFLEISIAKGIIEGWQSNHAGQLPVLEKALEIIIYYAENDAYPPSFFG